MNIQLSLLGHYERLSLWEARHYVRLAVPVKS